MTRQHGSPKEFSTELHIEAPRDNVWRAIIDDTEIRRWFAPEASVDPTVGGEIVWQWRGHVRWPLRIEVLEPGVRLRTRYDSGVDDGQGGQHPLFVDFLLSGDGGTTRLRLVHSGFGPGAEFDEEYDGISAGWPVELQSLRLYVERHLGRDRGISWGTCTVSLSAAEAWQHLTSERGFRCGTSIDAMREGDPFRFETTDGDVFEGTALHCHPHGFCGVAKSHKNAFLRISAESWGGSVHPWCWLGAYDVPAEELQELERRWQAMFERLWGTSGHVKRELSA